MKDTCEIVVKGQLDTGWSGWLEGLTIRYNDKGETIIAGPIRDQAALYGVLVKMRDLALFLISVRYVVHESQRADGDVDTNS